MSKQAAAKKHQMNRFYQKKDIMSPEKAAALAHKLGIGSKFVGGRVPRRNERRRGGKVWRSMTSGCDAGWLFAFRSGSVRAKRCGWFESCAFRRGRSMWCCEGYCLARPHTSQSSS